MGNKWFSFEKKNVYISTIVSILKFHSIQTLYPGD